MANYANSTTNTPQSKMIIAQGLNAKIYVGPQVFQPEMTEKDFGKIYLFDQTGNFDRTGGVEREDGAPAKEVKADYSTINFTCKTIAAKHMIPDKFIRNADPVIAANHKKGMSMALSKMLWKDREQTAIGMLDDSANFSGTTATLTGVNQWSDYNNSDPWTVIAGKGESLEKNCEQIANFVYIEREVVTKLMNHPKTLAIMSDMGIKVMSLTIFKAILMGQLMADPDMPFNIYIGRTTRNTGAQTVTNAATRAFQGAKTMIIGYQNPNPGVMYEETFAKMLYPQGIASASVEEFRVPGIKALWIEVEMVFGFKIIHSLCAQQILNCVA